MNDNGKQFSFLIFANLTSEASRHCQSPVPGVNCLTIASPCSPPPFCTEEKFDVLYVYIGSLYIL